MGFLQAWTNSTPASTQNVSVSPAAGHVLLAWQATDATSTAPTTIPSGFETTPLIDATSTNDGSRLTVWIKKNTTGSETTVTMADNSSNQMIAGVAEFSDIDTTTPLDVAAVPFSTSSSVTTGSASITPVTNGCTLAIVHLPDGASGDRTVSYSTTSGTTSGWTVQVDQTDGGFFNAALGTASQTTAAALTAQASQSISGGLIMVLLALRSSTPAGPSISSQPQQQTANAGATATFSVTAAGGTAPYSYQWQTAPITDLYADVPGAWSNAGTNSSSYTTGTLSSADNGTWVRVTITDNASQTVTSAAVRLFITGATADTGMATAAAPPGLTGWAWTLKKRRLSPGAFALLRKPTEIDQDGVAQPTVWADWFFPQASGGVGSVGLATETDAALPLGAARPAGLSSETDSALALAAASVRGAGLATEADSAQALAGVQIKATGLAVETDAAQALAGLQIRATGLASETDAALALSAVQALPAGVAAETDTALGLTAFTGTQVGAASEADSALSLSGVQVRSVGIATESDSAIGLPGAQRRTAGLSSETDSALSLGAVQIGTVGLAPETDTALQLFTAGAASVGLATENDEAFALTGFEINAALTQVFTGGAGPAFPERKRKAEPKRKVFKARQVEEQQQITLPAQIAAVDVAIEADEAMALRCLVVSRGLMRTQPAPRLLRTST